MGIRHAVIRHMTSLAISLAGFWLAGCAAQLQLWSDPAGALVTENDTGRAYRTPVVVNYTPTAKDRDAKGCLLVKGYTATWQSGARTSSPQLIQLCGPGPVWNYVFLRPADAPNLATDRAIESQIMASRAAEALAKQQATNAFTRALVQGFVQGMNERSSIYVPSPLPTSGPIPVQQTGQTSLPQITPDGTYVSGNNPYNICPNGKYVSGNCTLAPDGTYVGQ